MENPRTGTVNVPFVSHVHSLCYARASPPFDLITLSD